MFQSRRHKKTIARREAEQHANQGLTQALERSIAVIEFDLDGIILRANDNFLRLTGYHADALFGQHHRPLCPATVIQGRDYGDFWRRLNAGEIFRGQFKRLGKHGRVIWLEASYNPVYDATGRLYKVVKYASDISERVEKHESDGRSASRAYHISAETEKVAEHGTRIIQAAAGEMREIAHNVSASAEVIGQLGQRSEQITATVNTIRGIAD